MNRIAVPMVTIPPDNRALNPLVLGGTLFVTEAYTGAQGDELLATMESALQAGINHFDTASGYGDGASEGLIGRFLAGRRDQVFLASKAELDEISTQAMLTSIDESRSRLQTDFIDLYYIHWPRTGRDMRPWMEGLETARHQGKIKAIGVSNFNVAQIQQVAEVGRVDANQLCYSLLWRFDEADLIPYCRANNIALVTYSSIAQGILAGKFPRHLNLKPDDSRARTVHFEPAVWPYMVEAVEQMTQVARECNRSLVHLAIRWVLHQPGINSAVVGARNRAQLTQNVEALSDEIPDSVFTQLTQISDEAMKYIPNTGNVYRHYV